MMNEKTLSAGVVKSALVFMANRCNYATSLDGHGFNKLDAGFGHTLAEQSYPLTRNQALAGLKLLTKYSGQLASGNISLPSVEQLTSELDALASDPAASSAPKGKIYTDGKAIIAAFEYDAKLVDVARNIKGEFPSTRFDGSNKTWRFPLDAAHKVIDSFVGFVVDPSVLAIFTAAKEKEVEAELEAKSSAARKESMTSALVAAAGDLSAPLETGRVLYKHQQEAVLRVFNDHNIIIADDMGTGKTTVALVAAKVYEKAFGAKTFVVARPSLHKNVWIDNCKAVGHQVEIYSNHVNKIPQAPSVPFVLIVDEAHDYQNLKSKRTKAMIDLAKSDNCLSVMLLTGTPIKNGRPANLFPLLVATKHSLAKNRMHYEKRYCAARPTQWSRWDVTGAANLDELHSLTKDVILRRTKAQCLDLPLKTRVMQKADLSPSAEEAYNSALRSLVASYRERLRAGLIQSGGEALVEMTQLRHAGSIAKVETAVEIALEVVEEGRQVVLFTEFEVSANSIKRALEAANVSTVMLTGDTPQKDRGDLVDAFQSGKAKAFVGTVKAGGVGLTLTAADTVVLVDRPWTPGDAVQAEDRTHRIGQTRNVTAVWIQVNGIDEKIDAILQDKQERIDLVLDGKRKTMRGVGGSIEEVVADYLATVKL